MFRSKNNNEGQLSIMLQRSSHIAIGIYLTCNDHVNISDNDSAAEVVMEMIENTFESSFQNMSKMQNDLITETMMNE